MDADKEKKEEAKSAPEDALQAERDRLLASLQRSQADFQNFRSRMERERAQWRDDIVAEAVRPLLEAFDGVERSLKAAREGGTLEALVQGVTQVDAQIAKALKSLGIEPVPALGKPFDPKLHEVLCQVPAPAGTPAGQVVTVVEQGYTMRGRLIRPARVTVAGEPSPPPAAP